jgi:UDP-glucose 4-epimerase
MNKKKLLITGGTGSFGSTLLDKIINDQSYDEIRVFSRDEKKQNDLRLKYNSNKLKLFIGDVRNLDSLESAVNGVDYIFHAAALKQVPSCEFFPIEATMTNVLGTNNLLTLAQKHGVKKVICLSTDKAAYPINAMGISKALMEKVATAKSRNVSQTTINLTRYGNVMASRGSVIPLFINQIKKGLPLTITNPNMTRFLMTLNDAIDLVYFAFENGDNGDLFVHKAPASTIETLAQALIKLFNGKTDYKIIGTRHGEKLYETLCTKEEMSKAIDMGGYYKIPADNRDLNYNKYFSEGSDSEELIKEYNSHNTKILNVEQTMELLLSVDYIREQLKK